MNYSMNDIANGKLPYMFADAALKKVKEFEKIFSSDEDDLSPWEASMEVEQNKKDLRENLIDSWDENHRGPGPADFSSEIGLARMCKGLDHVGSKAMMHMFHDEPGYGIQVNSRLLKKYFMYCSAMHAYEFWRAYIKSGNFWGGLKTSEMYFFMKLVDKNHNEKVSLLSEDEAAKYRKAVVDVYAHLDSDRFDKMPEAIGLAMADPFTLTDCVKKYGAEKTAKGVEEWFQMERQKRKQETNKRRNIVAGVVGASAALPTAVFAPNMPMIGRGVLGVVAAVSGWLALAQLKKHDEKKPEQDQVKMGRVATMLTKYAL